MSDDDVRMPLLAWVQRHTILRRRDLGEPRDGELASLVSDNEAMEELLDIVRRELDFLMRAVELGVDALAASQADRDELRDAIDRVGFTILDGDFVGRGGEHHRYYLEPTKEHICCTKPQGHDGPHTPGER